MPNAAEIQRGLTGAWRMMMGRADGLAQLDISADGFWGSFVAIPIAAPALLVGWTGVANQIIATDEAVGTLSLLARFALVDLASWLLPLVGLAVVARAAGIADRYPHYVIATNWASALIVWIMLPPALLRLFAPQAAELADLISLGLFLATLVLSWRLTNVAIGKGGGVATAVFTGMIGASLFVLFGMQDLLGLDTLLQGASG